MSFNSSTEKIDLEEALRILEISDIDGVSESDLKTIKRRALKRWHPDTIAYTNPSDETVKIYERNTRLVSVAIDLIRAYLNGEYNVGEKYSQEYDNQGASQEAPEDVIRRNAINIQEMLRKAFSEVQNTGYKVESKAIEISDGFKIRELLEQDLKDNVLVLGLMGILGNILNYVFLSLLGLVIGLFNVDLANIYFIILSLVVLVQIIFSFIAILPLSRFWLPAMIGNFSLQCVNNGLSFYQWFNSMSGSGCLLLLPISIMILVTRLAAESIKWLILMPAFMIVGMTLGDKRIGVVRHNETYFAGVASWYAYKLIDSQVNELNVDDLQVLSYLYSEYSEVWRKWARH